MVIRGVAFLAKVGLWHAKVQRKRYVCVATMPQETLLILTILTDVKYGYCKISNNMLMF